MWEKTIQFRGHIFYIMMRGNIYTLCSRVTPENAKILQTTFEWSLELESRTSGEQKFPSCHNPTGSLEPIQGLLSSSRSHPDRSQEILVPFFNLESDRGHIQCTPFVFLIFLRSRMDEASSSSTSTVDSQFMQASVMLTPFFKPLGPSAGTFWFPSLMLDSIMTPTIPFSPALIWSATVCATLGWLRWSLFEFPGTDVSCYVVPEMSGSTYHASNPPS